MNQIEQCPICDAKQYSPFMVCKDYTVSKKDFSIVKCNNCGFLYTNAIPTESTIGDYYESEEYISHSNTNKGLINQLYQKVRNITLQQKLKLINRLSQEKKILDIGCGTGEFLNVCQLAQWECMGVEPSDKARSFAQESYGLKVETEEALKTIPDESYPIISMWHVLEHVYHLQERVQTLYRILQKNGVLIVAVPNCSSYDAQHYQEHWAAYDVPRHLYHFQPKDIQRLFERFDFQVEEILPMKFDAYYVSMLSEQYKKSTKSLGGLINAFRVGVLSNLKAAKINKALIPVKSTFCVKNNIWLALKRSAKN